MRTALYEPTLHTGGTPHVAAPRTQPEVFPQGGPVRWRSQYFSEAVAKGARKQRATRYERFTTRMVLVSSVIMLGVTASLHVFNYGLETKTSSTSGTHGSFYKEGE